jgi:hypothetical protein
MFETVHTCTDWYDGPRRGVADLGGVPHLFESQWADGEYLDNDTYLLTPIDLETLALALEDWAIWQRWVTAFHRGEATRDTHPALPADRPRHDELDRLLAARLMIDPGRSVRKFATFHVREDPAWSGYGWRPLAVEWSDTPPGRPEG